MKNLQAILTEKSWKNFVKSFGGFDYTIYNCVMIGATDTIIKHYIWRE